jgi:hypothetical protein
MTTPSEQSKANDRTAYRNEMRRQFELHQQDIKIKKNIMKVLFLTVFLIALAAVSVSESISSNPASNLNSPIIPAETL